MKISIDNAIPHAEKFFSPLGSISLYDSSCLDSRALEHTDVLIVRSTTKVDGSLLQGTPVAVVASATSGIDHINLQELTELGISCFFSRGANAGAVVQYALCALLQASEVARFTPKTYAVIGVGAVGAALLEVLVRFGHTVTVYDPYQHFEAYKNNGRVRVGSLQDALGCEVIFIHAALHDQHPYPSRGMISEALIAHCPKRCIIINAARGGIVSDAAVQRFVSVRERYFIADVFPSEPEVSYAYLEKCLFATPPHCWLQPAGKIFNQPPHCRTALSPLQETTSFSVGGRCPSTNRTPPPQKFI